MARAMVGSWGIGTLVALLGACGEVPTFTSTAARIYVTSMTSGDPIEPDGYGLSLDGRPDRNLKAHGTLLFTELEAGPHTLTLSGISSGCAVLGENPRTVQTTAGRTAQTLFLVRCTVPGTGRILVQTFTYGVGPDHYRVDLDVGRSALVGANAEVTFDAVRVGPVTITLTGGVEEGCQIAGPNPRTLLLREGLLYASVFKIHCPG